MQRKTLTERLTNKYQLIVRNEENFADRWTISFNFARLLVILTMLVLLFYALVTGINFLAAYLLGGNNKSGETQMIISLAAKVDSLEYEMETKDQFIVSFKNMLDGGERKTQDTVVQKVEKNVVEKTSIEEEEFREKFEKEAKDPVYRSKEGYSVLYFFAPIAGKIINAKQNENTTSVYINADKNKPVKSLDDGIVVSTIKNADSTYKLILQYKNGLLTVYDHIRLPLVKTGAGVGKGSVIAAAAEQKIVFSMAYNGKFLNPSKYIAWDK
ncbi:MAG TPA: M23 family metallopeptidase [Cytophagaceae bacterium]|jgi:murein DD-endopeptidase MepM/ murein hydrolase activator NlpD|nr:M23 family metallopeptidase [Cytophagaceae bacterium]